MERLSLRKIKLSDKIYFAKWWRDPILLKLTSGELKKISDKEVDKYFDAIYKTNNSLEFMIDLGQKTIGHISLVKRKNNWYEMQIVIGDKKYWNKGYGTKTILLLMQKAKRLKIHKIFLEVRLTNKRAIKAYENSGFVQKRIKKYPKNKNLPETLRMEKFI
jgi:RimJ/RimL family protein N-acetyltransferase